MKFCIKDFFITVTVKSVKCSVSQVSQLDLIEFMSHLKYSRSSTVALQVALYLKTYSWLLINDKVLKKKHHKLEN